MLAKLTLFTTSQASFRAVMRAEGKQRKKEEMCYLVEPKVFPPALKFERRKNIYKNLETLRVLTQP